MVRSKEKLVVELFGNPEIDVREVLPNEDIKDKNKKPFIARKKAILKIAYIDKKIILKLMLYQTPSIIALTGQRYYSVSVRVT